MAFCPRCGAATTPGMSFCTACGENLPAVVVAPATGATAASPAPGPSGPVGKRVHPWAAVALAFVFSSVYPLWFWWRASREMDAYRGSRSHPVVRLGVAISAAALALSIAIGALVAQELDLPTIFQDEGGEVAVQRFRDALAAHPWTPYQVVFSLVGAAVLYSGLWRLWNAVRDEDQRRGRVPTFDPRLALAILATGTALPLLAYVIADESMLAVLNLLTLVFAIGSLVVIHQVQSRLNETWQAPPPPAADAVRW